MMNLIKKIGDFFKSLWTSEVEVVEEQRVAYVCEPQHVYGTPKPMEYWAKLASEYKPNSVAVENVIRISVSVKEPKKQIRTAIIESWRENNRRVDDYFKFRGLTVPAQN